MKYLSIIFVSILLLTSACVDTNKKTVKYIATGAISAYNLQYLDNNNELVSLEVIPQSAQEQWVYQYIADQGDIVYLSGNYKDINSALSLRILIDGKIYKQGSNSSDTLSYLTISGTIPY